MQNCWGTSPTPRCCARSWATALTGLSGPRALLVMAAHPGRVRRLLRPHRRARRPLRAAQAHGDGDERGRVRLQLARRPADRARARDAPPRERRAGRAGRPVPGRHALPRRRPRAAAVDPRRARRVGDARLRQVRALAVAGGAGRRCGPTTAWSAAASGCASATCRDDAAAFPAYMAAHVRERRAGGHAAGARAGDRHRAAPAGATAPAARARAGQPGHGRAAPAAASAASTASRGTPCAASRCTGARSTSSAWSSPSCPSGCG